MIALLVALLGVAAPPNGGSLLEVLGALVAAVGLIGGSGGLFALYRYRRQGAQERDSLIGEATDSAVHAAKGMLEEYRIELALAKSEIAELRGRISRLEEDLRRERRDRDKLEAQLAAARERREEMEHRVAELEMIVERREGERRQDPPVP